MKRHTRILLSTLLIVQPGWMVMATGASAAEAVESAPAPASASEVEARQIMTDMARFLSGHQKVSVKLLAGYEVVQESGQKIEFGEKRKLSIQRPDKLRIEKTGSDGGRDMTLFDGAEIVTFDAGSKVYASAPQTGDIDATVVHFVRDLGMRLPLAPLVMARLPEELEKRVLSVDYVEKTDLYGAPCHHIAGRTAAVDFEMWIEDGKQPLLRKVALTYRDLDGQPRFWADFSDWDLSPHFWSSEFQFKAPADAKKVAFAAEIARTTAQPAAAAAPAPAKGAAR